MSSGTCLKTRSTGQINTIDRNTHWTHWTAMGDLFIYYLVLRLVMKIKEMSLEQRPIERLNRVGAENLSDSELLAILLNTGSKNENVIDMSNRLISMYGLSSLSSCSLNELRLIKGIGFSKASRIISAFELSKRVNSGKICEKVIRNSSDVAAYYMEKLKDKKKEYFIAVFLDSKNKMIKDEVVSIGTLNSSLIHPREIFKSAIKESANSLILVHNHPSGDPTPSIEDENVTSKLIEAGKLVDIKVLDHIVVGRDGYRSLIC